MTRLEKLKEEFDYQLYSKQALVEWINKLPKDIPIFFCNSRSLEHGVIHYPEYLLINFKNPINLAMPTETRLTRSRMLRILSLDMWLHETAEDE